MHSDTAWCAVNSHCSIDALVGQRLRELRLLRKMSQAALAQALGVTFQQVQAYERGSSRIGASRLYDIAEILDVDIGCFFAGTDEPAAPTSEIKIGDSRNPDIRLIAARPAPKG